MAIRARKNAQEAAFAAVSSANSTRKQAVPEITSADATDTATAVTLVNELKAWFAKPHFDVTEDPLLSDDYRDPSQSDLQVDSDDATDETTLVTLVNDIKVVYGFHLADTKAHKAADGTNVVTNADATDAATAATLITEIKDDYEAHRASTTFHPNADGTNTVTNADATDQATAITLANEIKDDLNAHISAAPVGNMVLLVAA